MTSWSHQFVIYMMKDFRTPVVSPDTIQRVIHFKLQFPRTSPSLNKTQSLSSRTVLVPPFSENFKSSVHTNWLNLSIFPQIQLLLLMLEECFPCQKHNASFQLQFQFSYSFMHFFQVRFGQRGGRNILHACLPQVWTLQFTLCSRDTSWPSHVTPKLFLKSLSHWCS